MNTALPKLNVEYLTKRSYLNFLFDEENSQLPMQLYEKVMGTREVIDEEVFILLKERPYYMELLEESAKSLVAHLMRERKSHYESLCSKHKSDEHLDHRPSP